MHKVSFLVIIAVFSTLQYVNAYECPLNWTEYYDYCYHKLLVETSFNNGVELCKDTEANLLTIDSKEEQDFVTRYLSDREANLWLDAVNSDYENWFNDTVKAQLNRCAVVMKTKRTESKWFHQDCEEVNEVVCKKPSSSPEPTTLVPPTWSTFATSAAPNTLETTTQKPRTCPNGWNQFKNKCYRVTEKATWFNESVQICEAWGSHLVSIHSDEENDFVYSLYYPSKHIDDNPWFRIGLISIVSKNMDYFWMDGSALDYTNWQTGCPDGHTAENTVWFSLHTADRWKHWTNDPDWNKYSVCSFVL